MACAIRLKLRAEDAGRPLRVTIYEGKDYDHDHNQCVGILSPPLVSLLDEELGIRLPDELVRRQIDGYVLHSDNEQIRLDAPPDAPPTLATRRILFDRFLLEEARKNDIEIVESRVTSLEFIGEGATGEARVYSERDFRHVTAVVGAFGADPSSLQMLEEATRKSATPYRRPPSFCHSYLTKVETTANFVDEHVGNHIHAFLLSEFPRIEFGAVSPKGDHLIVNVAGRRVTSLDLDAFLKHPAVAELLPEPSGKPLPYYHGRFPTAPSRHTQGNRYLTVGDATGWLRPFKGKGINAAVVTGIRAAETLLRNGTGRRALATYHARCRDLRADYRWGTAARLLCRWAVRMGTFDRVIAAARKDERLQAALYDAVSGDGAYRGVLAKMLRPRSIRSLLRA